ncbi:MAG: CsbD family protein [Nitrospirae bacterium]|nr:CsbD family protein [Nitrospirota bacterium]
MNSSMKDKVEGTYHEATGKLKEVAGKVIDSPELEVKGRNEKVAGKVQEKLGEVKKVMGS